MHVLRKVYPGFFRFLLLCNDDSRFSFFLYMGDARSQTITQKRERERERERDPQTPAYVSHRHASSRCVPTVFVSVRIRRRIVSLTTQCRARDATRGHGDDTLSRALRRRHPGAAHWRHWRVPAP